MEMDNLWWVVVALIVLFVSRFIVPRFPSMTEEARHSILEFIDSGLIALILVFFFIRPFVVQAFYIPSESMTDTLLINDRILVNKWIFHVRSPRRQDIVVFRAPPAALGNNTEKKDFIKRLIGLPGDVVEVRHDEESGENKVFVNDKALNEPYIKEIPDYEMKIIDGEVYEIRPFSGFPVQKNSVTVEDEREVERVLSAPPGAIPQGRYLVFGDNRNDSNDGHKWGFLPQENLLGKAMVIFFPIQRIRLLDHEWKAARHKETDATRHTAHRSGGRAGNFALVGP